jgi:hypothetical protein
MMSADSGVWLRNVPLMNAGYGTGVVSSYKQMVEVAMDGFSAKGKFRVHIDSYGNGYMDQSRRRCSFVIPAIIDGA